LERGDPRGDSEILEKELGLEKGSVLVKEVGEEGSVEGEVGAEREGEAGASSSASIMSGGRRSFSMSDVRL